MFEYRKFGDSAFVSYYPLSTFPKQLYSVNCSLGGTDLLYGGEDVDYIVGGSFGDSLHSGDGMDLVFGDHANITCSEMLSHQLQYATTVDHDCAGGNDTIFLGAGDVRSFTAYLTGWSPIVSSLIMIIFFRILLLVELYPIQFMEARGKI